MLEKPRSYLGGFYQVHVNEEIETIGTGIRTVFVERIGKTTITVRCPYTFASATASRAGFEPILQNATPVELAARRIRKIAKERRRCGYHVPDAAKRMYANV